MRRQISYGMTLCHSFTFTPEKALLLGMDGRIILEFKWQHIFLSVEISIILGLLWLSKHLHSIAGVCSPIFLLPSVEGKKVTF